MCGVAKLYDTLAGWLEPYRDTGRPIPIDWVASGRMDSMAMLVRAMDVARWRQNQPMSARAAFKTIIVQLDEASDLRARGLERRDRGAHRDAAVPRDLGGDEADAHDVRLAVLATEAEALRQVVPHHVPVE